jgi:putative ABC transport system substrate-binding protein
MKRTVLLLSIFLLATLISGWINLAAAQQAGKVYRIGYQGGTRARGGAYYDAFRQRLRELGYVEGQNLVIERRHVKGKASLREQAPKLAAEFVRLKVDVIVAGAARIIIRALQRATRTIPIVMRGVNVDPVRAGFVESLARPGGNITGLTNLAAKLAPKRLELLKEAFPRISRVAILWHRGQQKQAMKEVKAVGEALGIQIQSVDSSRATRAYLGIEGFLSAISQERPDALLVEPSFVMIAHRARIIEFTANRRLSTIYAGGGFVRRGGLMSYSRDRLHLQRRVAAYVAKILKGAKPADLPIEQPTKFNFVVNLKTAKALGLTIPPVVLARADKVIK